MQKEMKTTLDKEETVKRAWSVIMTESFIHAIDNWLRTENVGVAELDEICYKFDVSFEDAIGVSFEIGGRRHKLKAAGCLYDQSAPVEHWPLEDRLELFEGCKRLFRCNQAGEPVKSRQGPSGAAIWGLVSWYRANIGWILAGTAVCAMVAGILAVVLVAIRLAMAMANG